MKVKDLIRKLRDLDQEAPVFGFVNGDIHSITDVDNCISDRVDLNIEYEDTCEAENIEFARFLKSQGYSDEGISTIVNGGDVADIECSSCEELDYSKKITEEHLIKYFEIDLDNCILTNKSWVTYLAKLINDPIGETNDWHKEIEEYWEERPEWGNPWEDQ